MTTRQDIPIDPKNPIDHLDAGYEGNNKPSDYSIPSCGLADVDGAVVNVFANEIGFQRRSIDTSTGAIQVKKPLVVFATGERFALSKRLRPARDTNGALILPQISIKRTGTEQTSADVMGRGMNQYTGTITIKRRLDKSDKDYQLFLNKLNLKNANLPITARQTGSFGSNIDPRTHEGALLDPHWGNNVWEIITVPQPQFWTQTYEITFWTNYTQHMNYMMETLFSSFLPQGKMLKLETDKGYWFIGYVDDQFQGKENFDDFTEKDRIIQYTFTMSVKSYLLAPNGPGNDFPLRRHLSAPTVTFDIDTIDDSRAGEIYTEKQLPVNQDKFALTEIKPQNPQEKTTLKKLMITKKVLDPRTGYTVNKSAKITEQNQTNGETTYYVSNIESLDEFINFLK